jgi:hypothetical protein
MLKELFSPVFVEKGKQRDRIKFKQGLNVILGTADGANSIGKTSALLAIDFAFGGETYSSSDGVQHKGHHDIFFCFSFNGQNYFFARNTETSKRIDICDNKYVRTGKEWKLDYFCTWLKEQYGLSEIDLSFRSIISGFFRIYTKNNHDERNPLLGHKNENHAKAIKRLIRLFDEAQYILYYEKSFEAIKERHEALSQSFKHGFIKKLSGGKRQHELNEIEICKLKAELKNLSFCQTEQLSTEDIKKANLKEQIKKSIFHLETNIGLLRRKINLINLGIEYGLSPEYEDFKELQDFFPDINLRKIHEVEKYHKKLAEILNKQFLEEKNSAEEELETLEKNLNNARKKLADLGISAAFSTEFLEKYTEIQNRINALEQQNSFYELSQSLLIEKKEAESKLNRQIDGTLAEIEKKLNNQLKNYNDTLYAELHKPPYIKFKGHNSYDFETPDDKGTGSKYKSLLIYDLSVLAQTLLPAIAHDSFLLKNVSDFAVNGIMNIYEKSNKQIFISFDKTSSYTQETQKIVFENSVLTLAEGGNELYGESWNREEKG